MAPTCHLAKSPPTEALPVLRSWAEDSGRMRSPPPSMVGATPKPLTTSGFWGTPTSGRPCHCMRWAPGRQMRSQHINWNVLSQGSSILISLRTLVGYAWNLAGVRITSLIAYIPNPLPLPMFLMQSNYGWKSVCNMRSSIFSSFHFGQISPKKKQKIKADRFEKSRFVPICWSSDYPIDSLLIIHNQLHIKINIQKTAPNN